MNLKKKEKIRFLKAIIHIYCSDNLNYGVQFARKFVDAPEKVKPAAETKNKKAWSVRTRMNLHNNEAGRQVSVWCHSVGMPVTTYACEFYDKVSFQDFKS